MELLTFILNIASSVLSQLITSLLTGKRKEVQKTELEEIVTRKVIEEFKQLKQKPQEQERHEIISKILDEINFLATKDHDLRFLPSKIELEKPVITPILPFRDRDVEKEVEVRLERLDKIIAQRRKELGLPPESKEQNLKHNLPAWERVEREEANDENSQLQQSGNFNIAETVRTKASAKWEKTDTPEKETPWQKRIKQAIREIQISRAGGEVIDEE